jgi:hypothetical protein
LPQDDSSASFPFPLTDALARAEVFANRLYRGLRLFEARWTSNQWEELEASLPRIGPEFSKWCVTIMFDGSRLAKCAGGATFFNDGDTSYDLFRVEKMVHVLERALRLSGKLFESSRLQITLQQPWTSTPRRIRVLIYAIRQVDSCALHTAFCSNMIRKQNGALVSLFSAARHVRLGEGFTTPLRAVREILASAFLNTFLKQDNNNNTLRFFFAGFDVFTNHSRQLTTHTDKRVRQSEMVVRASNNQLRSEKLYCLNQDKLFQIHLTLVAINSILDGSPSVGNSELQKLRWQAVSSNISMAEEGDKFLETTLFLIGPLYTFTKSGLKHTCAEWNDATFSTTSMAKCNAVCEHAKTHLVATANALDAQNLSSETPSAFVTRVLDTLCRLAIIVYNYERPCWEALLDRLVSRKRKSEKQ